MRLTTNTRCMLYTAAVLILCAIAQATFAAETAPVVNVNTATAEQLSYLPGIGATLAGRIIEDRQANGPYTAIEQMGRVKGIGAAKLAKIRPYVVLTGDTTATAKIKTPKAQ